MLYSGGGVVTMYMYVTGVREFEQLVQPTVLHVHVQLMLGST